MPNKPTGDCFMQIGSQKHIQFLISILKLQHAFFFVSEITFNLISFCKLASVNQVSAFCKLYSTEQSWINKTELQEHSLFNPQTSLHYPISYSCLLVVWRAQQRQPELQTDTFSFSCKTSLSFFCFQIRNFSESSFICLISCTRWAFIAYTCTKKRSLNITLDTSLNSSSITGFGPVTYLNLLIKLSNIAH